MPKCPLCNRDFATKREFDIHECAEIEATRHLPSKRETSFDEKAAYWSWRLPVVVIGISLALRQLQLEVRYDIRMLLGYSAIAAYVVGLVLSLIALRAALSGRLRGVAVPSFIGVCVNGGMLAIIVLAIYWKQDMDRRIAENSQPVPAETENVPAVVDPPAPPVEHPIERPAEPWISKPRKEWPQMVLSNYATFDQHTELEGASSFLIKTSDGRVLAATARHLIGSAGGVEPPIPISQFNTVLRRWDVFVRTDMKNSLVLGKLGCNGLDQPQLDWLILSLRDPNAKLISLPLQIRPEKVRIGEKLFLIGVPYNEKTSKQNVYECTVTRRFRGDFFSYDLNPPVHLPGFSGAPLIDERGYVVGVMTVAFNPKKEGENYLEGGGEEIATIYDLIQRKP